MLILSDSISKYGAAFAVIAAGLGASIAITAVILKDPKASFLSACDDAMRARLKAPSTYRRIDVAEYRKFIPQSYDEVSGEIFDQKRRINAAVRQASDAASTVMAAQAKSFNEAPYEIVAALVKYEAQNSYGVPLVGSFDCRARHSDEADFGRLNEPLVDGLTQVDWAIGMSTAP